MKKENKLPQRQLRKESKITSKIKNRPIAFFDSGVGGLTVYSKLKQLLPEENYLYFGDTANMPYGEKSKEQLLGYADNIIRFFINKNAKAIVMACNTTSSTIYDDIKNKYNIKIYPIIQSAANILAQLPIKAIGVFATNATVKSNVYKLEIQKHNPNMEVIQIACPEWVKIVEERRIDQSIEQIRAKVEEMLQYNPEGIVLGCTHYPFLKDVMSKFAPENMFIDPAIYFAEFIKNDMEKLGLVESSNGEEKIYVSSNPEEFKQAAKMFYEMKEVPELINFKHSS